MKIVDIADEIWQDLGSPTDDNISAIAFWLRANVGKLNNLIFSTYSIDSVTLEALDDKSLEIGAEEASILKQLYNIVYYDRAIRRNLGAAGISTVLQVESDGGVVRLANRNDISKTYIQAKNQSMQELNNLITGYKLRKATPLAVTGDDTSSSDRFTNRTYRITRAGFDSYYQQ